MSERETFTSPPTESSSPAGRGINLVSRYETAIASGLTLSSIFWIQRFNDLAGIGNEIKPATLAELGTVLILSSTCATAIRSGDKPSQVLKSIGYVVSMPLRRKKKSE